MPVGELRIVVGSVSGSGSSIFWQTQMIQLLVKINS